MIYSRSTEYAIRALVPLAQAPGGRYTMVKTLAEQENIPAHFLAKILQQLARKGLLRSSKGPQGGFTLNVPADEIHLMDIVQALDGIEPFQNTEGGEYCASHREWVILRQQILDYLTDNTVADLVRSLELKRRAAERKPKIRAVVAGN